jgi:hypothetical protein
MPPSDICQPPVRMQALDVRAHSLDDRLKHLISRRDAVLVAEDLDPSCLLTRRRPVGAEVQPEEDRVAEVAKSLFPGAAESKSMIPTVRPSRRTKLHGERSL